MPVVVFVCPDQIFGTTVHEIIIVRTTILSIHALRHCKYAGGVESENMSTGIFINRVPFVYPRCEQLSVTAIRMFALDRTTEEVGPWWFLLRDGFCRQIGNTWLVKFLLSLCLILPYSTFWRSHSTSLIQSVKKCTLLPKCNR